MAKHDGNRDRKQWTDRTDEEVTLDEVERVELSFLCEGILMPK
jgi:hypothetical protein